MSPRDCSWFLAGVLVTVAVTMLVLRPWDSTTPSSPTTAAVTPAPAAAHATSGDNAGSLDEVTQKLAARLATTGGTDSEWMLLAQSYDYMGRTADAAAARSHIANAPVAGTSASAGAGPSAGAGAMAGSLPPLDSQTLATVATALDK